MSASDAQKSEVHATTADASTSPAGPADQDATRRPVYPGQVAADTSRRPIDPMPPGTQVVCDDTDEGGPLVVKSDDPDLNPPRVTKDPFPTERTPEIDPPVAGRE